MSGALDRSTVDIIGMAMDNPVEISCTGALGIDAVEISLVLINPAATGRVICENLKVRGRQAL